MTRYINNKIRNKEDTPISIGPEWTHDFKREYVCSYCNRTLSRIIDSSGQNPNLYCSSCQISTPDDESENLRSLSKITTPDSYDHSSNPAVSYPPEPSIGKKKKEIKGGLKAMSERGSINITSYVEGKG